MKLKIEIHKKVKSPQVIKKAQEMLKLLESNDIRARKTFKFKYRVLEVQKDFRLLERIPGTFELLTHETYNKLVDKQRKVDINNSPRGW